MPELDIGKATAGNATNTQTNFSVNPTNTDGVSDLNETYWDNNNWSTYLGFYKSIPEMSSAIDAKARWSVGKGFKADESTTFVLQGIKGFGKDTFNTILENAIRTYHIGGDSFMEIIRDDEGNLINLKPLDPGTIRIVVDKKGIVKRYEQKSKSNSKAKPETFEPTQILHLCRNRTADEIHGISIVENLKNIVLSRNEAMTDMKLLMHRHVKPLIKYILDTQDPTKIAQFIEQAEKCKELGEDLYLPKDTAEHEIIAVPTNATLNPLPWINDLNNYFYEACGVPQIIVGGGREITEASAKILYLAFQQTIEEEQLYLEESIFGQLGLIIELEFPADLTNEMLSDKKKDQGQAIQPNDTTAGSGQ